MASRHVPRLVAGGVLAAALCAAPLSFGQVHDPSESAVQHGRQLRQEGRDAEAVEAFRTAWVINHAPRARGHMGLAEQALERWLEAEEHLSEALSFVRDPWIVRTRTTLEASLDTVRSHIAMLRIDGGVEGAEVRVDGRLLGRLPMRVHARVNASLVRMTVRASGYETLERTLELLGGETRTERISLRPVGRGASEFAAATPARAASPSRFQRTRRSETPVTPQTPPGTGDSGTPALRWVGLGFLSVGVVGMVVAGIELAGNQTLGEQTLNARASDPGAVGAWARFQQQVNASRGLESPEVCALAELSNGPDARGSRELCNNVRASAMRALLFGLGGVALAGTGALMMALSGSSPRPTEQMNRARRAGFRLLGVAATPTRGGLAAGLAIAF